MPQISKVERSFVIRTPAAQMHSFWSTKLPLMSTIVPHLVNKVTLLQGRWEKQGSVIAWDYNFQGKPAVSKQIMEVIDKKKYKIVYKEIGGEGGPLDYYKNFKWIFQAFPNDNIVIWTLEYEKNNDIINAPEATAYLDLLSLAMEPVDSHLNGP